MYKYILTHCCRDKIAAISMRHFQMHFLNEMYEFRPKSIQVCSQESIELYSNIGSDNGVAPNRSQAIIQSNDGWCFWRIHTLLGLKEFNVIAVYQILWIDIACYRTWSRILPVLGFIVARGAICHDEIIQFCLLDEGQTEIDVSYIATLYLNRTINAHSAIRFRSLIHETMLMLASPCI